MSETIPPLYPVTPWRHITRSLDHTVRRLLTYDARLSWDANHAQELTGDERRRLRDLAADAGSLALDLKEFKESIDRRLGIHPERTAR